MKLKKVQKLRRELGKLRAQKFNLGEAELSGFAKKLGRWRLKKQTSEPQWITDIPGLRPISIPGHKAINPYTAASILDSFEMDLEYLEEHAERD